jgi:hypothetical protein
MNQRNDVFIDCHVIFDCNCIIRFWSFLTLAINFLSPVFDAFIDSSRHVAISLFHSLICTRFVKSRLVNEVTNERKKDRPRIKSVEIGIIVKFVKSTIFVSSLSKESSQSRIHFRHSLLHKQLIILIKYTHREQNTHSCTINAEKVSHRRNEPYESSA